MNEQEELIHRLISETTDWHAGALAKLDTIIDSDVKIIKLGEEDNPIIIEGEKLQGFRSGLIVARSFFAKLPFQAEFVDGPSTFKDQSQRMEQDRQDSVENLADQQDVPQNYGPLVQDEQ